MPFALFQNKTQKDEFLFFTHTTEVDRKIFSLATNLLFQSKRLVIYIYISISWPHVNGHDSLPD